MEVQTLVDEKVAEGVEPDVSVQSQPSASTFGDSPVVVASARPNPPNDGNKGGSVAEPVIKNDNADIICSNFPYQMCGQYTHKAWMWGLYPFKRGYEFKNLVPEVNDLGVVDLRADTNSIQAILHRSKLARFEIFEDHMILRRRESIIVDLELVMQLTAPAIVCEDDEMTFNAIAWQAKRMSTINSDRMNALRYTSENIILNSRALAWLINAVSKSRLKRLDFCRVPR
jgi:hypothetical protein